MTTYATVAHIQASDWAQVKSCNYPGVGGKSPNYLPPHTTPRLQGSCRDFYRKTSSSVSIPHPLGGKPHSLDLTTINNETSRENLRRHCQRGHWVKPNDLKFGDAVNLCISHDIYGTGVRYYLFWKMTEIDGQQCPLFLTQITNGLRGPSDSPGAFFQKAISFVIEDRPERNVFVNAANVVALIPPSHGRIFLQLHEERKGSDAECVRLREYLDHLSTCHSGLLRLICQHARHALSQKSLLASIASVRRFLQQNRTEKCHKADCKICRMILDSTHRKWYIGDERPRDLAKLKPEEDLCAFLTGQGKHFEF